MPEHIHGDPVDTHDLLLRVIQVANSIPSGPTMPPVVVEYVTRDPYTVTRGVVTAVGVVDDQVLLTVEPTAV